MINYNHLFFISSLLFGSTSLIVAVLISIFAKNTVHKTWALFNFLVAWWGLGLAISACFDNPLFIDISFRAAIIAGILIPAVFCHFVVSFTKWPSKKFLIYAYAQATFFNILTILGKSGYSTEKIFDGVYYATPSHWIYYLLTACWISSAIYGLYLLWKHLFVASGEIKIQLRYLTLASIIGFVGGGVSHWLPVYGFHFHPAWNISIILYTLLATYAIFRHRLLGIDFVIRKSLVYTLFPSLLSFAYFLILLFTERIFQQTIGYRSFIFTIITIAFIAVISEPLRHKIQSFIDHLFYRGTLFEIAEERELLHEQIREQDRMKAVSTLAAGMAHEIKNPLTSIKTFAEYLPRKYDDPEFREKFQRIVVDEVDRVGNIVQQLLEFSKPQELDLHPISISEILDGTLSLLNNNLLKSNIQLIKNYNGYFLEGDKNQLKQVFLNIFLNSIQAMPYGGRLVVSTNKINGQIVISVEDTGLGIAKENIPHLFDPFFTTKEGGTGLGLSIVHGIITKHGGKIKVESSAGEGTTLRVYLKAQE